MYIGVSASITRTHACVLYYIYFLFDQPLHTHTHIEHTYTRSISRVSFARCGRRQIRPAHTSSAEALASYCKLKIGRNASTRLLRIVEDCDDDSNPLGGSSPHLVRRFVSRIEPSDERRCTAESEHSDEKSAIAADSLNNPIL